MCKDPQQILDEARDEQPERDAPTPEEVLGMKEGETPSQHRRRTKYERREKKYADPEAVLDAEPVRVTVDDLDNEARRTEAEASEITIIEVDVDASDAKKSVAAKWAEELDAEVEAVTGKED